MKSFWRRAKGAVGLGAIWGAASGLVGLVGGMIGGLFGGGPMLIAGLSGVAMATVGLVLGTGFGSVLTLMHGNRTLDELSVRRAAGLGFLAGAGPTIGLNLVAVAVVGTSVPLSVLATALLAGAGAYGLVTAVLASGTVALAKRAPEPALSGAADRAGVLRSGLGRTAEISEGSGSTL